MCSGLILASTLDDILQMLFVLRGDHLVGDLGDAPELEPIAIAELEYL